MYELGRWARARYARILESMPYDADVLHTLSSGLARCIMSAELFLAGFYPPKTENEQWHDNLLWQPIPVYSDPRELDKVNKPILSCRLFGYSFIFLFNTDSPPFKVLLTIQSRSAACESDG